MADEIVEPNDLISTNLAEVKTGILAFVNKDKAGFLGSQSLRSLWIAQTR